MQILLVNPDGTSGFVNVETESSLYGFVGEKFGIEQVEGEQFEILFHELWKVAEMELNIYASLKSGTIIGGPVVIRSTENTRLPKFLISEEEMNEISKQCGDLQMHEKMKNFYTEHSKQNKFSYDHPDRWIYNGKFFDAIVIAPYDECSDYFSSTTSMDHEVWFFRSNPKDPKIVKIVDHTLFNALEVLIDADELAASGEPPEWVSNFLGS